MPEAAVYERVDAVRALITSWPDSIASDSESPEHQPGPISPIVATRVLTLEAWRWLDAAARLARTDAAASFGAHILMLRPALTSIAKAAWIVRPDTEAERLLWAAQVAAADRKEGASAMAQAVRVGAPAAFSFARRAFELTRRAIIDAPGQPSEAVAGPLGSDSSRISQLGEDIDCYYGTSDVRSDLQLLWNTSSSLAHGERWYATLTGGERRTMADVLSERSFDGMCSAITVTHLRVLGMA